MVTTEEIRQAVHIKADEADEATLISMLEAGYSMPREVSLNKAEIEELNRIRQDRINGVAGFTLNEIVAEYRSKKRTDGL